MILKYSFKNILSFLRERRIIFAFFVMCLIATSLVFMYIYTSFQSSGILYNYSDLEKTAIYIYPQNDFDYSKFEEKLVDFNKFTESTVAYMYTGSFYGEDTSEKISFISYPFQENENVKSYANPKTLYSGIGFKDKQLADGDDVCIVCGNLLSDKIVIDNKYYLIVGAYDVSDKLAYGFIPFRSALKNNLVPVAVIVQFKGIDSRNYSSVLKTGVEQLQGLFPSCIVESIVHEKTLNYEKELNFTQKVLIIMTVMVMLTMCFVYSYIFQVNENKYAVIKLCGGNRSDIEKICIGELLIFYTAQYILSCVIFECLFRYFLYQYEPVIILVTSFTTYIICYILEFALMMIMFMPFIKYKSKQTSMVLLTDNRDVY